MVILCAFSYANLSSSMVYHNGKWSVNMHQEISEHQSPRREHEGLPHSDCTRDNSSTSKSSELNAASSKVHGGNSPNFHCFFCKKTFAHGPKLFKHLVRHYEKKVSCDICFKQFRTRWDLSRHSYVHAPCKSFRCIFCSKCYQTPDSLRCHQMKLRCHILKWSPEGTCNYPWKHSFEQTLNHKRNPFLYFM